MKYIIENYVGSGPMTCAGCPTNVAPYQSPIKSANTWAGAGDKSLQPEQFRQVANAYNSRPVAVAPFERPMHGLNGNCCGTGEFGVRGDVNSAEYGSFGAWVVRNKTVLIGLAAISGVAYILNNRR